MWGPEKRECFGFVVTCVVWCDRRVAYLNTSWLFADIGRIVGTRGGSVSGLPSAPAITIEAPTSDSRKNECQCVYIECGSKQNKWMKVGLRVMGEGEQHFGVLWEDNIWRHMCDLRERVFGYDGYQTVVWRHQQLR